MTYFFDDFAVSAEYTGSKPAEWSNGQNWNHHKVTVRNTQTGKRISFDFWASIMHSHLESRYDVLNAFRFFVDDALCGSMSFDDFCNGFGYNNDSLSTVREWKACQKSAEKLQQIFGGDIYDLLDSLEEFA